MFALPLNWVTVGLRGIEAFLVWFFHSCTYVKVAKTKLSCPVFANPSRLSRDQGVYLTRSSNKVSLPPCQDCIEVILKDFFSSCTLNSLSPNSKQCMHVQSSQPSSCCAVCGITTNRNFPSQGELGVPGAPGLPVSSQYFIKSHYSVGTFKSRGMLKTRSEVAALCKYSRSAVHMLTPCSVTLSRGA